jgi:ribosomal protein S8
MLEYPVSNINKDKFEDILEEQDYISDINLKNVTIEQAINGKVWTDIKNSWTSDNKIPRCEQVCKQNKRDKFVKEIL